MYRLQITFLILIWSVATDGFMLPRNLFGEPRVKKIRYASEARLMSDKFYVYDFVSNYRNQLLLTLRYLKFTLKEFGEIKGKILLEGNLNQEEANLLKSSFEYFERNFL